MGDLDHLAHLAVEAAAFGAVLRAAPATTPVPACPDWTLGDLARHVGAVHRWVAATVASGEKTPLTPAEVSDDALPDWFDDGAQALLTALTAADPTTPCPTLVGPGTAGFWRRRMALETLVHRVDAERALGPAGPVPADLAADGVEEVVDVMHPRQVAMQRTPAPPTGLALVDPDTGRRWQLGPDPATATVTGPAAALLELLWRRAPRTDPRLTCHGDLAALDALLAQSLTP